MTEAQPDDDRDPYFDFQKSLEGLINSHSIESRTSTPDFILAEYVVDVLKALESKHRAYLHWSSPSEKKTAK